MEDSDRIELLQTDELCDLISNALHNDEEINLPLKVLLQSDQHGQTLLHWAAVKGNYKVAKFIIKRTGKRLLESRTQYDQYNALHLAAKDENSKILNLLVDESKKRGLGDLVNLVDKQGNTALHDAANRGNTEAFAKLYHAMSTDAIVLKSKYYKEETVLHMAVKRTNTDIIEILLSNDEIAQKLVSSYDMYGQTPLQFACYIPNGAMHKKDVYLKMAQCLCEKMTPKDIDMQNCVHKNTALHFAVQCVDEKIVELLIRSGADPSITDQFGQTALHWAADKGNVNIITILCKAMKREDINTQIPNRKQTALHFAVQKGHCDTVISLLEYGAASSLQDVYGQTAVDWAMRLGYETIINYLSAL